VVGATYPEELNIVRRIVGNMPILIPGIGAQGGDIEKTVKAGVDSQGKNAIINSSRGIIFASNGTDFTEKARIETTKLRECINQYRYNVSYIHIVRNSEK
jgi:orotidine-5'-phosphate decarboxylase